MPKDVRPLELPLLPLRGVVVFPGMIVPIPVGRPRSIAAVQAAAAAEGLIALVPQRDTEADTVEAIDDLHAVGVAGRIMRLEPIRGGVRAIIRAEGRIRVSALNTDGPDEYPLSVTATPALPSALTPREEIEAEGMAGGLFEAIATIGPDGAAASIAAMSHDLSDHGETADLIGQLPWLSPEERIGLLAEIELLPRLRLAIAALSRQHEIADVKERIANDVREELGKHHREAILREQMRAIAKEIGEEESEADTYRQKIADAVLPDEVRTRAEREVDRLGRTPSTSPESGVIRTYIDWILALPWSTTTEDRLDLVAAAAQIDTDHFGLEKAKDRIVEYMAVRKLSPEAKGPILCFVGAPGVGKTSLGKSIATALGRKYARMSLGGVSDEAEIRGHRRTYVGAMPGRIVRALRDAGSMNPVIVIDEIDKLGSQWRGDPAAALLEVLDPELNHSFSDHYLELGLDLSKVIFIATANVDDSIPDALFDRMEAISLPGYTAREKVGIARAHLVPKQLKANGLSTAKIKMPDATLKALVAGWTDEPGVRNLERQIGKILRKIARAVAEGKRVTKTITAADLPGYLGPQTRDDGKIEKQNPVGAVTGIAVSSAGGDTLTIEAVKWQGPATLKITGQIGDVMKESAEAAFAWLRSNAATYGIEPAAFEETGIHLHVPDGATPKDGPSAGIAIATALTSLLTNTPVRRDVAMTGEITTRGRILPIGGVKEKLIAAHAAGAKTVLLPKVNERDLVDLPAEVREAIEIIPVERIEQVIAIALAPKGARSVKPTPSGREKRQPAAKRPTPRGGRR
jgi:ATP-dependent Lon protease